jgi:hypothetical protein
MEIHAPEGHVQSARDVLIHLGIVTIGILIALSLEQTVEWYHHRELAIEARENVLSEIRDNKKELESEVSLLTGFNADARQVFDFVSDMLERGKSDIKTLRLRKYEPKLNATSWSTAQAVGAINYMPYGDVKRYAAVYRKQEDYLAAYSRSEEAILQSAGVFSVGRKLDSFSHAEMEAERGRLMTVVAALTIQLQQGQALTRVYDNILSGRPIDFRPVDAKAPAAGTGTNHKKEK